MYKSTFNRKSLNPFFLIRKIWLYGRSAYILNDEDIILACYPKTGSTWIRYFLLNLLASGSGENDRLNFDDLNETMPEFGHPSIFNLWPFDECSRFVKTHRPYNFLFRKNRVILLIRDPRDIMVSFYHYASAKKVLHFDGSFKDILYHPEMGLEAFFKHYQSWKGVTRLILKYEDLKKSPLDNFKKLCAFCGIEADDVRVGQAIEMTSLKNVRKAQESSSEKFKEKFKDGFVFARKGTVAQWKEYFDDKSMTYYKNLKEDYRFDFYD